MAEYILNYQDIFVIAHLLIKVTSSMNSVENVSKGFIMSCSTHSNIPKILRAQTLSKFINSCVDLCPVDNDEDEIWLLILGLELFEFEPRLVCIESIAEANAWKAACLVFKYTNTLSLSSKASSCILTSSPQYNSFLLIIDS